jgi:hypothetical protein
MPISDNFALALAPVLLGLLLVPWAVLGGLRTVPLMLPCLLGRSLQLLFSRVLLCERTDSCE